MKKSIFFAYILLCLLQFSCGSGGRIPPPPPPCESASVCGRLVKLHNPRDCTKQSRFSQQNQYRLYNDSPDKKVHFLIEFYQQRMYQNWPVRDPIFINSNQLILNPNNFLDLGCEYAGMLPGGNDDDWIKNIWRLKKACFAGDESCLVLNNPAEAPSSPRVCDKDCSDEENPYCLKTNICRIPNISWLGVDMRSLYKELINANMANDAISLKTVAPEIYKNCPKDDIIINQEKFSINGPTCDFAFPIKSDLIKNLWLRLPSNLEGLIENRSEIKLTFDNEYSSPIIIYELINEDGTTSFKEELVDRLILDYNNLFIEGKTLMCYSIDFCGD